jgi:tetratricopeptide (TPR) repeat protein
VPAVHQKADDGVLMPMAAARFLEGEISLQHGDYKNAVKAYGAALAMDAKNPFVMASLAWALWKAGSADKALHLVARVLEQDPEHELALNRAGMMAMEKGDTPAAEDYFKRAVAAAPESRDGYLNLIDLYKAAGNLKGAFAEAYAESAQLAFELGKTDLSHERTLQYIELAALEDAGERPTLLIKQAAHLLEAGKPQQALFLVQSYRALYPDDPDAVEAEVAVLAALGNLEQARAAAGALKDEALLLKAQLLFQTGDYVGALAAADAASGSGDESTPAAVGMIKAVGWTWLMDLERGRKHLDAIPPDEGTWRRDALEKILVLLLTSGREAEAAALLAGDPLAGQALERFEVFHAAALALASGLWPEGKEALEKNLSGLNVTAILLRWSRFLAGSKEDAAWLEENIDGVIAAGGRPAMTGTARTVKAVLVGEGVIKVKETELLDLIVKIKSDDPACALIPSLQARFFHLIGNRDRAALWFDEGESRCPADAMTLLWHAELLLEQGKKAAAGVRLEKALGLKPPLHFTKRILALLV